MNDHTYVSFISFFSSLSETNPPSTMYGEKCANELFHIQSLKSD